MEPERSISSADDGVAIELGPTATAPQVARSRSGPSISPHQVYQQLPLDADTIRVIDLDWSANTTAPLTGTLRVIRLKDCPEFTALSYVWGKGGTGSIRCNDCAFAITPNCHEALVSLRSMYKGLCIWVDAISINQEDDAEKDGQIPMMGEIYTWASAVYVWLGPGDDRCARAIKSLKMASTAYPPRFGPPWVQGRCGRTVASERISCLFQGICYVLRRFFTMDFFWLYLVRLRKHCAVGDLDRLLGSEWLTRVWTFQEFVLASNPMLVCGKSVLPWSVVQRALMLYRHAPSHDLPRHLGLARSDNIDSWWYLLIVWMSISRPTSWHGKALRLLPQGRRNISVKDYSAEYLEKYHSWYLLMGAPSLIMILVFIGIPWRLAVICIAQDYHHLVRDLLTWLLLVTFGACGIPFLVIVGWQMIAAGKVAEVEEAVLVGMLKALRERNSSVAKDKAFALHGVLQALDVVPHKGTKVESAKPLGQIYYELFRDLLLWNPRLICLLLDVGPPILHAPSWVPDWSTLRERSWIQHHIVYEPVMSITKAPRVEVRGDNLTVQGIILGEASFVTGPFNQLDSDNLETNHQETRQNLTTAISQFSGWLRAIRRDVPLSPVYESIPEATRDALHGRVTSFDGSDDTDSLSFGKWRRVLSHWDISGKDPSMDGLLAKVVGDRSVLKFTVNICNALFQRRGLFFSIDGHIGSGPPDVLVGDKIVLLNGVSRPLVLRECAETAGLYNVIGPAFVCGFTNWKKKVQQVQSWNSFTLV